MLDAIERMKSAEAIYFQVQEDNKKLAEVLTFFQEMVEHKEPLAEYYVSEWLEDYERMQATDFSNHVTNEDTIYNELTDQYLLVKKLLLLCATYINDDERE